MVKSFEKFVPNSERRTKYPPIDARESGFLEPGDGHKIYWEECGNPDGEPVIFLHGGPGGGCEASHRQYFDPKHYRIFLMDQRGCNRSTPFAALENNTTWHLVEDIERLRKLRGVNKWQVFGGSWGSTLSLAYAVKHPEHVSSLILRGIFLCRPKEIHWFYQFGAHHLFPDKWEDYLRPIPLEERGSMVEAYYERLTSNDKAVQLEAARAWSTWEGSLVRMSTPPEEVPDEAKQRDYNAEDFALPFARIECHYFINDAFFDSPNWILENAHRIAEIPGRIVHGRYDVVTPLENAWDLHKMWPIAELEIIPDAGHAGSEGGITDALIRATDDFRGKGR